MFRAAALVILLVHPTISETVLQHFMTQRIDGVDRLVIDPSVRTDSEAVQTTSPLIWLALLLIVVGIPLIYIAVMLWARRKLVLKIAVLHPMRASLAVQGFEAGQRLAIKEQNKNRPAGYLTLPGGWLYQALGFTFANYNSHKKLSLYYEPIRILRKFLLIAVSVFFVDPLVQGYLGLCLLILNACVIAWTKPFR
jgi:hypothetical protein